MRSWRKSLKCLKIKSFSVYKYISNSKGCWHNYFIVEQISCLNCEKKSYILLAIQESLIIQDVSRMHFGSYFDMSSKITNSCVFTCHATGTINTRCDWPLNQYVYMKHPCIYANCQTKVQYFRRLTSLLYMSILMVRTRKMI